MFPTRIHFGTIPDPLLVHFGSIWNPFQANCESISGALRDHFMSISGFLNDLRFVQTPRATLFLVQRSFMRTSFSFSGLSFAQHWRRALKQMILQHSIVLRRERRNGKPRACSGGRARPRRRRPQRARSFHAGGPPPRRRGSNCARADSLLMVKHEHFHPTGGRGARHVDLPRRRVLHGDQSPRTVLRHARAGKMSQD